MAFPPKATAKSCKRRSTCPCEAPGVPEEGGGEEGKERQGKARQGKKTTYTHIYMYVCMYVRMYVCTYVRMYVCTYVRMYVCTYVRMYVCTHARMYVCMSVYVCVCLCMSVYVCVCVCMSVNVNVYVYVCVCICICSPLRNLMGRVRDPHFVKEQQWNTYKMLYNRGKSSHNALNSKSVFLGNPYQKFYQMLFATS